MKLRDLRKCNGPNDGTRTLFESILADAVLTAFTDWCGATSTKDFVVIGGLALSYYGKPRTTVDADLLFLTRDRVPFYVEGFKKNRPSAFIHKDTHMEVEVLTPETINLPRHIAEKIHETARVDGKVRVASPSGLIVSKLGRFSWQDRADIAQLCTLHDIDLEPFGIPDEWMERYKMIAESL